MSRKSMLGSFNGFVAAIFLIVGVVIGSHETEQQPNAALIGGTPIIHSSLTGRG